MRLFLYQFLIFFHYKPIRIYSVILSSWHMKRHEVRCPNCQEKNRLDRSQIQFNCTACGKKFRLQRKADQSLKQDVISDVLGKPYTQRKQSRAMAASSNAKIEDSAKSELSPQARHYLQTQDRKKILTPDQKIEQYTSVISCGLPQSRYPHSIN